MTNTFRWLRAVVRIESRTIFANPFRTLLVVLLIGLPVAGIVAGQNLLFLSRATPAEKIATKLGLADLRIHSPMSATKVKSLLPESSTIEPIVEGTEQIIANGRQLSVKTLTLNLSGLASGFGAIVEGQTPVDPTEIAVTLELLSVCSKEIGDTLKTTEGVNTIVGCFENPEKLKQLALIFPHRNDTTSLDRTAHEQSSYLVALPDPSIIDSVTSQLSDAKIETRESVLAARDNEFVFIFVIGCFALAEAALIVASAFIVGIRRRQREIGLIASIGANRLQVVASVMISAVLTSVVAVLMGAVLGIAIAWCAHPYLDNWNGRRNGIFEVCWGRHLIAMAMGILTAVAAAFFPALATGRMTVKAALSSRRPAPGDSSRWVALGITLVLIGTAMVVIAPSFLSPGEGKDSDNISMLMVLLGSIFGIVGFGICSPWILGIAAKFCSPFPLPWRLAVRETGRFRTRNGPIITAIVAGMSLSILFATLYQSIRGLDAAVSTLLRHDQIVVSGPGSEQAAIEIADTLNGMGPARLSTVALNSKPVIVRSKDKQLPSQIAVASRALLSAAGIDDADGAVRRALDDGKLVHLTNSNIKNAELFLIGEDEKLATLSVFSPKASTQRIGAVGFIVSQKAMQQFGWRQRDGFITRNAESWLIRLSNNVDRSRHDRASKIASEFPQTTITSQLDFTTDRFQIWSFFFVSFLSGLVVLAIATALASAEAKSDQRLLAIVGAPPSVSIHQSAARSAFLALLGSTLAIPAGLLPAYGLLANIAPLEFCIPWLEILVIAIGLPVAAYVSTWATKSCRAIFKPSFAR